MLSLRNITKKYKQSEKIALDDVSLDLPEQGLVTILGESGSGKSTLLNIIGSVDKPTSGDVLLDDKNLLKLKNKQIDAYHNKYVGFIHQSYNLINYLSVYDNVSLVNNNKNISKILKELNIYDLRNKNINQLSGGQMQRVAIARALNNNPKVLLCDEPTGALDKDNAKNIMEILKKISKHSLVIVVTHDEELASFYSDRIIKLSNGKIISDTRSKINFKKEKKFKIKSKVSFSRIWNIVVNNLKSKKTRNILTTIAFSIGLSSLLLVLSLSMGFNDSLKEADENYLGTYPIYISKTSVDTTDKINKIINGKEEIDNNSIHIKSDEIVNDITSDYIESLKQIDSNLNYRLYNYYVDNKLISSVNSLNILDNLSLISGEKPKKDNEVVLIVDKDNSIDPLLLKQIGLNKSNYEYKDLIGFSYKVNGKKYKIVGIYKIEESTIYYTVTGLIYYNYNSSNVPDEIYLYPKFYKDKDLIRKYLKGFDVSFTDYADTVKTISKTLIDGTTIVLIFFSAISLIVSTIMIGIITYINIIEKTYEIGIFKSLGISNRQIKEIFYLENIIISTFAGLLSILLLEIIKLPINNLFNKLTDFTNILDINITNSIIVLLLGIVLSIIGSMIPILTIKRYNIIDTIRHE